VVRYLQFWAVITSGSSNWFCNASMSCHLGHTVLLMLRMAWLFLLRRLRHLRNLLKSFCYHHALEHFFKLFLFLVHFDLKPITLIVMSYFCQVLSI
jgi:hypothetical protein